MQIYLKTLGCRLNEAELERWARDFQARGHRIVTTLEQADLVVINSCAVTTEAVRKSRKMMHRAHQRNPTAKLVVSGCYASLDPRRSSASEGVDLVVENRDKDRLVEIVCRELDLHAMPQQATLPDECFLPAAGRQRAFIKVQDGCRYRCTFCIVTQARGEERSRPLADVVTEINRLHAQGIQEVVLTGVHIGGYGSDHGSDLGTLIGAILEHSDIPRLRLGALEPWDLPPGFWQLFQNPRFMPHLHLPLQSGSDRILRRMARRCKAGEFERLAGQARDQVTDFNLTTDIIVGFPGEGDAEWRQTMELVERIGFGHLHIFAYSPRPGTLAATMPGPVPRELIRERSAELHRLGQHMKREYLSRFVGRRLPVLIETRRENGYWSGYTPNFMRVEIADDATGRIRENRILEVRLDAVTDSGASLRGTPGA